MYDMFHIFKGLYGEVYAIELAKKPDLYWEVMEAESKELSDFAIKYMFLPSSTASLERYFLIWSYVHDMFK